MCDLMVLAFQADVTRVATFMFANEGSNRSYPSIGVPEGHHDLSHHGNDPKKHAKIRKINRFHIEQFAYLLGKLKAIQEGDGTLLDNSHDRLRQRHRRRQPPQPRRPADPAARQGRRHDQAGPAPAATAQDTPLHNLYLSHARPDGRAGRPASATARGGWRSWTAEIALTRHGRPRVVLARASVTIVERPMPSASPGPGTLRRGGPRGRRRRAGVRRQRPLLPVQGVRPHLFLSNLEADVLLEAAPPYDPAR